jgi:mRNA interferase HigB
MRIIAIGTLRDFWRGRGHEDAERPLRAWIAVVRRADWAKPSEIKADFNTADVLRDGRAVFDIGGNKYRLVVWINYPYRVVYIRFIGTHAQYDKIDAQTV